MSVSYLSPAQIKQREVEILVSFDRFAKQHHINYSLAYGTLLGAVRHNGFIPWDDDIDVMVCRDDYNKIIECAKRGCSVDRYQFIGYEIDGYALPFIKVVDTSIIVESKAASKGFIQYLWIDIFPLDDVPTERLNRKVFRFKCSFYRALIKVGIYKFFSGGKTALKRAFKMVAKPAVMLFGLDRIAASSLIKTVNSYKSRQYSDDGLICNVCWGPYGEGECFPAKWMRTLSEVEFEGHRFPAIEEWDKYLTQLYGEYMQLPPLHAQVAHEVIAYFDDSK